MDIVEHNVIDYISYDILSGIGVIVVSLFTFQAANPAENVPWRFKLLDSNYWIQTTDWYLQCSSNIGN